LCWCCFTHFHVETSKFLVVADDGSFFAVKKGLGWENLPRFSDTAQFGPRKEAKKMLPEDDNKFQIRDYHNLLLSGLATTRIKYSEANKKSGSRKFLRFTRVFRGGKRLRLRQTEKD
jgi:hypothetical protein